MEQGFPTGGLRPYGGRQTLPGGRIVLLEVSWDNSNYNCISSITLFMLLHLYMPV